MPLPNKVWLFIYCWGFLLQYVLSFIIWLRIGRAREWATSTWEQQAEETKQSIPLFRAVLDYPSERRSLERNFSRSAKVNAQLLNVCDVNGLRDEAITPFWSSWISCSVNENHIQKYCDYAFLVYRCHGNGWTLTFYWRSYSSLFATTSDTSNCNFT